MKKINIGGVPEHFNLPWLDAVNRFDAQAKRFHWWPQPQGTGAMVEALAEGTLDVAVMLTEGAVAALARGADWLIEHTWVESPLQWGIHVPGASALDDEASIRGQRYAISRFGSGSHLMSYAHARARGWPLDEMKFVVVGTLEGAVEAFEQQRAEVFFWERYMTAPLVDAGTFRRVGVFEAPWPAFVVCVSRQLDTRQREALQRLYVEVLSAARAFAADPAAAALRLAETFGIDARAARRWLSETRWAESPGIDKRMLGRVAEVLRETGLIEKSPEF